MNPEDILPKNPPDPELDLDPEGLDPSSATGTRTTLDPDTGAVATGGAPLTGDSRGISASTIGAGTRAGEEEYKQGDFDGASPNTYPYDRGVEGEEGAKADPS